MITTTSNHGLCVGDQITISFTERRWYVRFWYFITLRKCPNKKETLKISSVTEETFTYQISDLKYLNENKKKSNI